MEVLSDGSSTLPASTNWNAYSKLYNLFWTANLLQAFLILIEFFLCLIGSQETEPLMWPVIIVKFNIAIYSMAELSFIFVKFLPKILFFNGGKERLRDRIIVRVARGRE